MHRPDHGKIIVEARKSRRVTYSAEAEVTLAAKEYVPPSYAHHYLWLRDRYPDNLIYAVALMKEERRHGVIRSGGDHHDTIDGKYATPRMKLVEANRVLAREGLPQIGPGELWA